MAIISVEIDDAVAEKLQPFTVVKYEDLELMFDEQYETLVDFGEGVKASEILDFLKK